ncbi:calcium-binding protein [Corallincola holothuriorum]|uniref:Calcium-binding protein n=1 Tax=Corallincola holothuriorum TaxID=2282215 RepID=A0A368NGQ3_9GAMM|nr:calcium-binding protein [Corallincola holothuriorum]RCU48804.1 calcium-binding protein [Corallincola holothuriorum]
MKTQWVYRGVLNCSAAVAFIGLLMLFGEIDDVTRDCSDSSRIVAAKEIAKNSFFGAAETIDPKQITECRQNAEVVAFLYDQQLWVDCKSSCSLLVTSDGLSGDMSVFRIDSQDERWDEFHTWRSASLNMHRINMSGSQYDDVMVIDDDMSRCIDVRMDGLQGKDLLQAGCGNDLIYGSGGNDMIIAQTGNDEIYGGTGNDRIWAGHGADEIFGQAGQDVIHGADAHDYVEGVDGESLFLGKPKGLDIAGVLENQAVRLKQQQMLSSVALSGSESLDFE